MVPCTMSMNLPDQWIQSLGCWGSLHNVQRTALILTRRTFVPLQGTQDSGPVWRVRTGEECMQQDRITEISNDRRKKYKETPSVKAAKRVYQQAPSVKAARLGSRECTENKGGGVSGANHTQRSSSFVSLISDSMTGVRLTKLLLPWV
ncbi:hypothetical protein ABBQ38_008306 [Trebouxia sp. C0009 RCD-2024]